MKAGCLFGNAVISFNVGGTTWVGRRHHVGSSKVGSCELFGIFYPVSALKYLFGPQGRYIPQKI